MYDQTSRVDSGPMEPWQQYLEALKERAVRIPDDAFGRGEMMAEAAHDAYQRTANQLTADGWDEESALMVTRIFGQTVKKWIVSGADWGILESELHREYTNWNNGRRES